MGGTLLVEGWRRSHNSYAVVNQWQCLALLRRPDVTLFHHDLPYFSPDWAPVAGLFGDDEAALSAIPPLPAGRTPDAVLRIAFPYDYRPADCPTWIFGTAEFRCPRSPVIRAALAEAARNGVGIITPSRWSASGFIGLGIPDSQVKVIPHGADPAVFKPMPEAREHIRSQLNLTGFVFLSIGSMTQNKGIDVLLAAFATVAKRHPEARLLLKGADALYRSDALLGEYLSALAPEDHAFLIPRISYVGGVLGMADMARLYQVADAYVSPYLAEGFNLPVLEAAACGIPVICTQGGPTDEFTTPDFAMGIAADSQTIDFDGAQGEYLRPRAEHLAQQMERAMTDDSWMRNASVAGPRHVQAHFTWDHAVAALLDILPTAP